MEATRELDAVAPNLSQPTRHARLGTKAESGIWLDTQLRSPRCVVVSARSSRGAFGAWCPVCALQHLPTVDSCYECAHDELRTRSGSRSGEGVNRAGRFRLYGRSA